MSQGRKRALLRLPVVAAVVAVAISAGSAFGSHQHGNNWCLNQPYGVYMSPTHDAATKGTVNTYEVWHHYRTVGNWSLGYIRATDPLIRGYIPKGTFAYETSHDATSC